MVINNSTDHTKDYATETSSSADISPLVVQQRKILDLMGLDIWVQRSVGTQQINYETFLAQQKLPEPSHSTLQNYDYQNTVSKNDNINVDITANKDTNKTRIVKQSEVDKSQDILENNANLKNASLTNSDLKDLHSTSYEPSNLDSRNLDLSNLNQNNSDLNKSDKTDLNKSDLDKTDLNKTNTSQQLRYNPIKALKQKVAEDKANTKTSNENSEISITAGDGHIETNKITEFNQAASLVEPFEVMAAAFNDWIILVDTKVLKNQAIATLWQNLINALSLTPQSLKFPICEGISDQESANASLAGFLFSISKNENANIAALSPMPEGTTHRMVKRVPYLSEMIDESMLKKKLWQTLNQ